MLEVSKSSTKINEILKDYLYDVAKTYTQTNFFKKHIEIDNNPTKTASSEASFILSAPPTLDGFLKQGNSNVNSLQLIGGVPQLNQSEQLMTQPFGELGSRLIRVIPGGTNYQIQFGRLYTKHSNIKFSLYKWFLQKIVNSSDKTINFHMAPSGSSPTDFSGLESELYNIPFGIIIVRCTSLGDLISADFCEMCMISNVGASYSADGVTVVENLAIMVSSIVPCISSNDATPSYMASGSNHSSTNNPYPPKDFKLL
jgi:hypothetical protein